MLLVLAALSPAGGGAAQPAATARPDPQPDLAAFDAHVAQAVREWEVPGLAIAVVKDDRVVFAKGYGVRRLGSPEPVDTRTRFAIGSTTKAMTALALGMLVDEGKVRWDDPVIRHLPGFRVADPYVTRELTVRDLLTHRGGLGNADLLWAGGDLTTAEIVARVATLQPAYSLRSGFVYQNVMYAVAGEVIAAASGMPWERFVRTRIFEPLGMTETVPTLAALAGQPDVAAPHDVVRDTLRVVANRPVDPVAAAGSVWSSVDDMARWTRFVLDSARVGGRRLVSEATFREWLTPQTVAPTAMYPTMQLVRPHFFAYGLGWFLHDYAGEAVAMHTGSIDGMSAIIGLLPDRRLGVYVLANRDHAELRHALMLRVFDLYRPGGATAAGGAPARDWSRELRALYGGLEDQGRAALRRQAAARVAGTRPSLALARYAGRYREPTYGEVVVTAEGDGLRLAFGRGFVGALTHWHHDTFQARWADERAAPALVAFHPDGAGGVAAVRLLGLTFARAPERD